MSGHDWQHVPNHMRFGREREVFFQLDVCCECKHGLLCGNMHVRVMDENFDNVRVLPYPDYSRLTE